MRKALGLTSLLVLFATALQSLPAVAQTHNFWTSGAPMPTALKWPMTGVINGKIYVVGGVTDTAVVANNQIYNPVANTWSTGAALPVTTFDGASAVVKNILYVFGGSTDGVTVTNAVWAYNPKTNQWSSKAAMPTARASIGAAVENNIIYVVGGVNGDGHTRLNTAESYNPATDTWTEEAPLLTGKSEPSVGLVKMSVNGTIVQTVVAADGCTSSSCNTGDNEGYSVATNSWKSLASDPTLRNAACAVGTGGKLYVAGGNTNAGNAIGTTSVYKIATNKWTTLASMPQAVEAPGSAIYKGLVYCIGGGDMAVQFHGNVFNYVQTYHP